MSVLQRPDDWLWLPTKELEQVLLTNATWPFLNISKMEFLTLQRSAGDKTFSTSMKNLYGTPVSAIGILFTALLIGTLWRQVTVHKNSFYQTMMAIAVTDLVYCILGILYYYWHMLYRINGSSNYAFMWILLGVRGSVFTLSLMSDMIAAALTAERCLSVSRPHLHKTLFDTHKKSTYGILSAFIILISLTRAHYAIDRTVQAFGDIYFFVKSALGSTSFILGLTMFSDEIMPFVLLIFMTILSTYFRIAVNKRQKKRKKHAPSGITITVSNVDHKENVKKGLGRGSRIAPVDKIENRTTHNLSGAAAQVAQMNAAKKADQEHRSMMILTLTLDALFLLNQLGFVAYWLALFVQESMTLSFNSTSADMEFWIRAHAAVNYADILSSLVECLTRAMNFPVYMALSRSMRREFKDWMKRIRCGKG